MQLPLPAGSIWPLTGKGFSISLWLRITSLSCEGVRPGRKRRKANGDRDGFSPDYSDQEHRLPPRLKAAIRTSAMRRQWSSSCLHVATLGAVQRQIEIWIDPETAGLICRLVKAPFGAGEVLCEASLPHMLTDRWQHLAMTFTEMAHGKRHAMTIQCYVDGCYSKEVCLEYRRPEPHHNKEAYLALGHQVVQSDGATPASSTWQMGSVMLFGDAVLTKHTSFHLACLGPDCVSISECDANQQRPDYGQYVSQHAVCYGGLGHVLSGQNSIYLRPLKKHLVLTYSPQRPEKFNLYTLGKAGQGGSKKSPSSSGGRANERVLLQQLLQQMPTSMPVTMGTKVQHTAHRGLHDAIHEVGGIGSFLFLFAKVIELSQEEKQQAQALKLLFTLIGQNSHLSQQFTNLDGYKMLAKVLATPRCLLGYEILQVLLDAALTCPILVYDTHSKTHKLDIKTKALVRNRPIITQLLLSAAWHRADVDVWKLVFNSLELLVRTEHPHREFNIQQLRTANITTRFMHLCQERIQKDLSTLPVQVCDSVQYVLMCMYESPPDLDAVRTLCSFLFWMHPAESHFVHSQVDQFYFVHKWASKKVAFSPDSPVPDMPVMDSMLQSRSTMSNSGDLRSQGRSFSEDENILDLTQLKRSQSMPGGDLRKKHTRHRMRPRSRSKDEQLHAEMHNDTLSENSPVAEHAIAVPERGIMTIETKGSASEYDILTNGSSRDSGPWPGPMTNPLRSQSQPADRLRHRHSQSTSSGDSSPLGHQPDAKFFFGSAESSSISERSKFSPPRTMHVPPLPELVEGLRLEGERTTTSHVGNSQFYSNTTDDGHSGRSDTEDVKKLHLQPQLVTELVVETNVSPEKSSDGQAVSPRLRRLEELASPSLTSPGTSEEWQLYPTVDATTPIPVRLKEKKAHREDLIGMAEEGHIQLYAGLLNLVSSILPTLKEDVCSKVLTDIIRPELLLAMAHHNAASVRTAVIKLLHVYLRLAAILPDQRLRGYFLQREDWHLLATQLHQHQTTRPLLDAVLTLMAGTDLTVDQGNCIEPSSLVPRKLAVMPVLALLEGTVKETALCHNALLTMKQIFETVPDLCETMMENALVETLCNVMLAIYQQPARPTDLGGDELNLLLSDVQQFLLSVTEKTFNTSGLNLYHHLDNCLVLLHSLEAFLADTYGMDSEPVGSLRAIQCHILRSLLEAASSKDDTPAARFFTTRLGFSQKVEIAQLALSKSFKSRAALSRSAKKVMITGLNQIRKAGSVPDLARAQGSTCSEYRRGSGSDYRGSTEHVADPGSSDYLSAGSGSSKRSEASPSELVNRFKRIITAAVELSLYSSRHFVHSLQGDPSTPSCEEGLRCFLLEYLRKALLTAQERSFFQRKTLSAAIMSQAKDVLLTQFSYLLCFMLVPSSTLSHQMYAVDVLQEPRSQELLKLLAPPEGCGQKLMYFLYNLSLKSSQIMSADQRRSVEQVMGELQACGVPALQVGVMYMQQLHAEVDEVLKTWEMQFARDRILWLKRMETSRQRLWIVMENDTSQLCKKATDMTKLIVDNHRPHDDFKAHIKQVMAAGLDINQAWQNLIHHLTHPRAVWHCAESAPQCWQLDPTEGPCRVRRRLMRCHLGVTPRFLSDKYQHRLESEKCEPPLSYLFAEDPHRSEIRSTIFMSHKDLVIICTFNCTSVTPSSETPGNLLIDQKNVFFIGDDASNEAHYTEMLLGHHDELLLTFPTEEVKELQKRWWQLRDNALEIFLTTGKTCLLAFRNTQDRDQAFDVLEKLDLPNRITSENLSAIQQLWLDGRLTNFEYLTHLNKLSGRSFNDLMQYPVFPFILSQYTEDILDLEDPKTYRNLSKPIAVQHKSREEKYIENYKWLELEASKFEPEPGMYAPEPYHYGSHYSNSGTVLHFLVRLPPFTQMFLTYQDHNFDLPDRTFHCMRTSWHLASYQSTTDVKELIPEFFFLPEFLINREGFNFGVRQTGEHVWDVKLPPWAKHDPRLFTLIHRQALESDHVTANLASWIDLVFGFKQSGKPAHDSVNVFHPATYFGVEVDSIADPLRRRALKTMIKTYGQTPKNLFRTAHPSPPAKTLRPANRAQPRAKLSALDTVVGLKWGSYVGSPDQPDPRLAWSQTHHSTVASLMALPTGQVFGLRPNSHLLVMYSKERGVTAVDNTDVHWAAILSWGHPDSIIRITNRKGHPPVNFLHWASTDQVTCCASVPDVRLLFLGTTSGIIAVIKTCFNKNKTCDVEVLGAPQQLCGHSNGITALCVCKAYSVLISASQDATCIVWDLNRLSYVFSINDHEGAVQVICASDTSGDIASVSHTESGSQLMLHTVNGHLVASLHNVEFIHSLVFSTCPEGRSVNLLAGGLSNGAIRMWSSWDLSPVRDIVVDFLNKPIVSLCFTCDCQQLYASSENGTVALWEKPSTRRKPNVSFIPFL